MITLEKFIEAHGSIAKAARAIGVDFTTLHRWKSGRGKPSDLARRRLQELGIKIGRSR